MIVFVFAYYIDFQLLQIYLPALETACKEMFYSDNSTALTAK